MCRGIPQTAACAADAVCTHAPMMLFLTYAPIRAEGIEAPLVGQRPQGLLTHSLKSLKILLIC